MMKTLVISLLISINLFNCDNNFSLLTQKNRYKRGLSCGEVKKSRGYIVGGYKFEKGDFPWMVVLWHEQHNSSIYICGGVLVTSNKVLTAAHCIYPKNDNRKLLREILLSFGAHELFKHSEPDRVSKSPKEIFIHPDWNPKTANFDGDISVLLLESEIPYNNFIQPVCLWRSSVNPTARKGIIIGYGKSEDRKKLHEVLPKKLEVPIVISNEDCFLKEPNIAAISSERTLCAGASDGSGPCLGDSGHGLFIKHNNVTYLRGLVSSSFLDNSGFCDTSKYTIYTDVLKYKDWIDDPSDYYEDCVKPIKKSFMTG